MGKGNELILLLKTGNSGEARKLVAKIKKQGKKKFIAALNEQDEDGCTALHYSACYNFLDFIEEFLEVGAVVDAEDNKGSTPLHMAATNGRGEAVSILLCRGADPNIMTRSGDTSLHLASQNGHSEVVEYLVRDHAKCTLANVSGQTALDLACQNGHSNVVSILLRSGQFNPQKSEAAQTALKLAAKHGHTQVLSLLIRHGFDVNRVLPGAHGTCLHEAALYGKIETVHYLLQCGADPSIKNAQGLSALDIVNHYTDPRSAQQLKQLLQDALANQARQRIAQAHSRQQQQLPHQQQQQQMYAQYYQQKQQQQQQQTQTQSAYPQAQQYSGQPQTQPQYHGQPQTHPQYPGQPQTHPQYPGQPQTQAQFPSPKIGGVAMPGSSDLAAMIAASRKTMTNEEPEDHRVLLRSATLAGGQRPQIERSHLQKRRSFSEESTQDPVSYERSNPPTLPRRTHMGPPSFTPVPPPADSLGTSQLSNVSSEQQVSHSSTGTPEAPSPPVIGNAALPLGEVKLKKVAPKVAPPPKQEPPSFDNELLAKLKKRQVTIDQPAPPTNQQESEPVVEVPVDTQPSQPQPSSPSKPAPKTKPKPTKPKQEEPKQEDKEEQPKQFTWQEEIARRKAQREREEEIKREEEIIKQEEQKREEERRREEERKKEEQRKREEERREEERKREEERRREEQRKREEERREEERRREEQRKREEERREEERRREEQRKREEERREEERRRKEERKQAETKVAPPPAVRSKPQQSPQVQPKPQKSNMPVVNWSMPTVQHNIVSQPEPVPSVNALPMESAPSPLVESYVKTPEPHPSERERSPVIAKIMDEDRPSTPSSSDQMSRSTSMNSVQSVPLSATMAAFECVPIGEWLISYKLPEYTAALEGAGYDNTDFLLGISSEELAELGVSKPGHRKRILSALSQLISKEHFLTFKPTSVAEWLQQLGLSAYENTMIESGYDDIDFITSVTEEELTEIGIIKKGHLKRFRKGIEELSELLNAEEPISSPYVQPYVSPSSPSHSISNLSSASQNYETTRVSIAESETPSEQEKSGPPSVDKGGVVPMKKLSHIEGENHRLSQDSGVECGKRQSGNFNKMKHLLEKKMGIPVTGELDLQDEDDDDDENTPHPSPPLLPRENESAERKPPPIPKRSSSTTLTRGSSIRGDDMIDNPESPLLYSQQNEAPPTASHDKSEPTLSPIEYTTDDINAVLEPVDTPSSTSEPITTPPNMSKRSTSLLPELDELELVLQGFGTPVDEEDQTKPEESTQTDRLLADIDDMLADLNDHLDVIIPSN